MNVYTENQATYGPTWDAVNAPLICASAVSWGAVMAGAAVAAALSLILLMLGTGLSLSAVSPWVHTEPGARAFGLSTILWVSFTSVLASAAGGYIAGRMRTKWIAVSNDEKHFRDTAHGLLAWAVASLLTAVLLAQVSQSIVERGSAVGAVAVAGLTAENDEFGYYIDTLFRSDVPTAAAATADQGSLQARRAVESEISRMFVVALAAQALPVDDMQHAAQLVAQHAGIATQLAEDRVNDAFARIHAQRLDNRKAAQLVADETRKASAIAALWLFISLLIGAFVASLAATFGGRQRDA